MEGAQTTPASGSKEWVEDRVQVAGIDLVVVRGGTGRPLLVLHEELGYPGWMRWQSELARERSLLIPMHPGFGRSPRLEWITSVRDLAAFYGRLLRERQLVPIDVIGFSLGGWIAAEMAVDNPAQLRSMILVGPPGIRPPQGEIFDLYNVTVNAYLRASVRDPDSAPEFGKLFADSDEFRRMEAWEDARIQTARLAWRPYMYNASLQYLLEGVSSLPTALIWGSEDRIVPLSVADAYHGAISGALLRVIAGAGHRPEIEKTEEFLRLVREFLVLAEGVHEVR
jgi:pimeloyl-ACP methyl ester carboxylesterase